jgi:starch synthase
MKVLFAASEIYPYTKTGGLADVADALPHSLKQNLDISRIMPFYGFMQEENFQSYDTFSVTIGLEQYEVEIFSTTQNGIVNYFVKAPLLSQTLNPYGDEHGDYQNNSLRFGLFSKIVAEFSIRESVTLLHLNDWHTALAALFVKESSPSIKTVFTIHNLSYQGVFESTILEKLSIDRKYFNMHLLEFFGKVNFMKAGVAFSDAVTTVSSTYAQEILTPKHGCGLEGFLFAHKDKISGILNGINYDVFDPAKDKALEFMYDAKTFDNKHKNKVSFIKASTLKDPRKPLVIMITRLVENKGINLIIESLDALLQKRLNLFIVGDGTPPICEQLTELSSKYDNFEFIESYNDALSHRAYAAGDILLMPSLFEPCGLNQFIAMHYGTLPLVHAVGGLKESVFEDDTKLGRGVIFEKQTQEDFLLALDRALELKKNSKKFKSIAIANMQHDVSFEQSALEYLKLYKN